MNHGVGVAPLERLSLNPASQSIAGEGDLGTTTSEMKVPDIIKIPMRVNTITWNVSAAAGDVLETGLVWPAYDAAATTSFSYPTYLSHLSRMYAYWRGSIDVKIEFLATQFYTGRVLLAYYPMLPNDSVAPDLSFSYAVSNLIMDLQENHIFTVRIPFVSPTKYKSVYGPPAYMNTTYSPGFHMAAGQFVLYVLNPLTVSDSSVSAIDINVYYSAGPDFEFSVLRPDRNTMNVFSAADTLGVATRGEPDKIETEGDMSEVEGRLDAAESSPIPLQKGSAGLGQTFTHANEAFMDLRMVSKRYGSIGPTGPLEIPAYTKVEFRFLNKPYSTTYSNTDHVANYPFYYHNTLLSHIAGMYVFWRGSLRYKFILPLGNQEELFGYINQYPATQTNYTGVNSSSNLLISITSVTTTSPDTGLAVDNAAGFVPINGAMMKSIDVEVPFYSKYTNMLCSMWSENTTMPTDLTAFFNSVICAAFYNTTNAAATQHLGGLQVYQAAGDDFICHYLVPPVPMLIAALPTRKTN
jgi:hypothetical protein